MSNVLELVNIRKSFGSELVLNNLSLAVPEHTATALIGASGSGKSTLLRCINLLESIDDGQIFLDGEEISDPLINVDDVRVEERWCDDIHGWFRRRLCFLDSLFWFGCYRGQLDRPHRDVFLEVLVGGCGINACGGAFEECCQL